MPRLRVVRCHSLLNFNDTKLNTLNELSNLKYLFLELNNLPFSQFEFLMRLISSQLQSLGICTADNDDYIHADRWMKLILTNISTLKKFYLHYSNSISNKDEYHAFHRAIQSFRSDFWFNRRWFFAHQHYLNQPQDGMDADSLAIFYSINPYRNHNYDLFEHVSNSECPADIGRNLARCLTIHGHRSIRHCEIKFENVTSIISSDEHMDNDHWPIVNINRIVPLENLTKLIVECDCICLRALFKILNHGKHIQFLELARYEISNIPFSIIKQSDHAISTTNNVDEFIIRSINTRDVAKRKRSGGAKEFFSKY